MPVGRKAFTRRIRKISPAFIEKHHSIITDDGNSSEAIAALRAAYIDEDERWRTADANSNHVDAISTDTRDQLENSFNRYVISGPARAYSQSTIEPQLPIKVSEGGRMVNGVIRLSGQRAMLTAAAGLSDDVTVNAGNETLDMVSSSASDTALRIYVFGKQQTTNAAKVSAGDLNGTSTVLLYDIADSSTAITYTEIYGAICVSTTDDDYGKCNGTLTTPVGNVTIDNVTSSTTLITLTAATDSSKGIQTVAAANRENTRGRHALVDFSALSAGDDVFIFGYSSYGVAQYELITQAANYGLRRETANRYQSIIYVATAGTNKTRTVAVTGYDSNVFKEGLQNGYQGVSNYTEGNCTQAAGVISIKSDEATDDAGITIVGVNSTTVVTEEITLSGTSDSAGSSNFTTVYGAYVSTAGTGTSGTVTVERTDAATKMFDFDTNAYIAVGILDVTGGHAIASAGTPEAWSTYDYCGANARPTITTSATSSTENVVVIGENEVGTATSELATLVDGVVELSNEYSRITTMASLHSGATEYFKLSVEQEDDAAQFCGKAVSAADAQGTIIHIRFKPAVNKARGITDRSIMQEIVGTTGVTRLDTLASTTRTITWPDLSGTPALTAYTVTKPSTIITVGTGCDQEATSAGLKAAISGASAGDTIWLFEDVTITDASVDFSKRLNVIGFGDRGSTITSAFTADATVDISAAGCEFENINFDCSGDAAGSIACYVKNVGTKLFNCSFDGGTNAAGIALDIDCDGADIVELYGCTVADGIIDCDGHASSIVVFASGSTADAVNLDTGTYYIDNFTIAGALSTGASAAASVYLSSSHVTGALGITTNTVFQASDTNFGNTFTHTAGSLCRVSNCSITGAVSVVAGTYLEFANVTMASTFAQTGAVTEMYIKDCDITSTFAMNTAAGSCYADGSLFTGNVTINHASAVFVADGCRFGGNLTSTDSNLFRVNGGTVAGNVAIVAGTIFDLEGLAITGSVALTGVVTESFFRDCDMASTFDMSTAAQMAELHNCNVTGVATINHANADFEAYDTIFGNNLVCTNATTFKVVGGAVAGLTTITAGSLHEISNATLTGNVSLVASTYLKISDTIIAGTVTQSGAITEGFLYNCDLAQTLDMGTAGAMLELHGCNVTGVATINHASADFEANDCVFGNNLVSTDSDVFRIKGGSVAGATTLTAGTLHELSDITLTGNVSLVESSYADFTNCRMSGNFAQTGAVTEGYLRDCDITGTFDMNTAAATIELHGCRLTGVTTINHASAVLNAYDTNFLAAMVVTDASTELYRNCIFNQYTNNGTSTLVEFYNPRITTGDFTLNNAALVVEIYGGNFDQELVSTNADVIRCRDVYFQGNGADSITITDVQTGAYFHNCTVADHFTITDATLIEIHNCTIEQFTDNDSDDINIYDSTFTGAVVPDSADWDSYNSTFLSTVTESAATNVDFWGGRIVGTLTQAAGTVNVHGTHLNADYAGSVGGIYSFNIPTDHYVIGANQMFTTVDLAVASIAANDTYHLPDQSYTVTTPSLAISQQTAWYGEGESTTITDSITADAVVDVSAAGCQFHNIHFTNTISDASTATALKMVDVGGEFHNCMFNGGSNAANLALDLDANGADITYFYNCMFPDGKIDANGHASSVAEFHNCNIDDAVELDTGTYIFRDCDFASTITSATAGTLYFHDCTFAGTVTVAAGVTAYFYDCDNNSTIDIAPTGIAYIYGGSAGTVDGPVVNDSYYMENRGSTTYWEMFDFIGDAIDDELDPTADAGSTAPAISSPLQGGTVIGVTDGTGADQTRLAFGANGTWHTPLYHAGMEARVQVDSIAIIELLVGFYDDAGDYAYIEVDVTNLGDAEPHYVTRNAAAAEVSTDCSNFVAISASTYYRFKVQMMDDGSVKFYIDDVLVGTSAADAVEKDGSTAMFMPIVYLAEQGAAAKTVTVDYVKVWGDRA